MVCHHILLSEEHVLLCGFDALFEPCEYVCTDGHENSHSRYMRSCVGTDMSTSLVYSVVCNLCHWGTEKLVYGPCIADRSSLSSQCISSHYQALLPIYVCSHEYNIVYEKLHIQLYVVQLIPQHVHLHQ